MEINKIIKAKIEFTDGNVINLELYPEYAPISVSNFVGLCKAHFYDGLCFHRVIDGFMIQGGGFVWDDRRGLLQKESSQIKGEFKSNGVNNPIKHVKGTISMARTMVKDSASSQFFICVADTPHLDGEYAAFGKCADEESVKVAVGYGKVKTGRWQQFSDIPFNPIVIKTITVED
ncbi:MAG: peptidylprolyl isomerase [Clostridiales bacterium]|nr:peptidylprolyl isomerase [Clostridiales bacterium]